MTRAKTKQRTYTYILTLLLISTLLFFSCASGGRATSSIADTGFFKSAKPTNERTFVLMKDSSIQEGEKISAPEGVFAKKVVRLDGKPIPVNELLGFQSKGNYFAKLEEGGFAKRVTSGRINIYRQEITAPGGGYATATYFQKNNGPIQFIGVNGLKPMLMDCPKAYDMLNISVEEHNKIIKKQPYFVQTVIETYNNCGEWQ